MSSADEFVALLGNIRISNYLDVAAAAILLYDHTITISQEVELVWGRKWSAVNVLFVANRLLGDLNALGLLVEASNLSRLSSCTGIGIATIIPESLQYINWALFSALRVYAVGRQMWSITAAVFVLSMVPFVTNVFIDATSTFTEVPFSETLSICSGSSNVPANVFPILEYVTRGALMLADVIVIVVTFWHTFGIKRNAMGLDLKTELSTRLLKDGSIYFIALLTVNVAAMVTDGVTDLSVDLVSVVSSVSTVVISRFLLNLRQLGQHPAGDGGLPTLSFNLPHISTVQFAPRVVGGMGAELQGSFGIGVSSDTANEDGAGAVTAETVHAGIELKEGSIGAILEQPRYRNCSEESVA